MIDVVCSLESVYLWHINKYLRNKIKQWYSSHVSWLLGVNTLFLRLCSLICNCKEEPRKECKQIAIVEVGLIIQCGKYKMKAGSITETVLTLRRSWGSIATQVAFWSIIYPRKNHDKKNQILWLFLIYEDEIALQLPTMYPLKFSRFLRFIHYSHRGWNCTPCTTARHLWVEYWSSYFYISGFFEAKSSWNAEKEKIVKFQFSFYQNVTGMLTRLSLVIQENLTLVS